MSSSWATDILNFGRQFSVDLINSKCRLVSDVWYIMLALLIWPDSEPSPVSALGYPKARLAAICCGQTLAVPQLPTPGFQKCKFKIFRPTRHLTHLAPPVGKTSTLYASQAMEYEYCCVAQGVSCDNSCCNCHSSDVTGRR